MLENRWNPAGTVTGAFSRGTWTLTGDDAPLVSSVFNAERGVAKSALHPPNPPNKGGGKALFATPLNETTA